MSGFEEAHEQALQLGMVIVRKTLSRFAESCLAARNTQSGQSLLPQHQDSTAVTADFIQQRHALSLPQDYLNVRGHVRAYGARWPYACR
jgi:hypothetical protein